MKISPDFDPATIEATILPLLTYTGVTFNGCHRERQGGTTVIRVHFRVAEENFASARSLNLRCDLVKNVIMPAAAKLRSGCSVVLSIVRWT